ncbi:MAG: lamin tail domain-containing protein, partial [Candidatus Zixiibacteriota bacterium]
LPQEYFVVCKKLIGDVLSDGFESIWGNDNGIWDANDPGENYRVFEIPGFSLKNDGDTVTLMYSLNVASVFSWDQAGLDGVSWERYSPTSVAIGNSADPRGSTPGEINSITPRQLDLALGSLSAWPIDAGLTEIESMILNVGLSNYPSSDLSFYHDPEQDGIISPGDLIAVLPFPPISSMDNLYVLATLELDGVYAGILAKLEDDDRIANNQQSIVVPGRDFPPVILSEFIADPVSPLATEWLEIWNRSLADIDLSGWLLGNDKQFYPISGDEYIIAGGAYLVLCKDSLAMVDFYGRSDIPIQEMSSWPQLKNDGDLIRMVDKYDYPADSFGYAETFGDNCSWSRLEDGSPDGIWGWSSTPGGTPGSPNDVLLPPSASRISVTVEPNPFSLSRDHRTSITLSVPSGEAMSMRIYDRDGRVVKTLIEDMRPFEKTIEWDGRSDAGRELSPGIYILFVEVFGRDHYKQTVVVSP